MTHHVEEQALMRRLDGGLHVGVAEDDVGTLAAQLQGDALDIVRGGLLHDLADLGRSGECNLGPISPTKFYGNFFKKLDRFTNENLVNL